MKERKIPVYQAIQVVTEEFEKIKLRCQGWIVLEENEFNGTPFFTMALPEYDQDRLPLYESCTIEHF